MASGQVVMPIGLHSTLCKLSSMEPNVYLIIGNDEAQISSRASKLVESIAGPEPDAFSFDVFEESEAGPEPGMVVNLMRSVLSPPFLGGRKTVWLKHFSAFSADMVKGSELGKALRELAALIEKGIPQDIVLIMDGVLSPEKKSSQGPLFKACSGRQDVSVAILSKPDKLDRNWQATMSSCILGVAKEKGMTLYDGVVEYLIDVLGTDTARIDSELEKVICYKGGTEKPVTLDDVEQVCVGQGEEFSWSFSNALGRRNLSECLKIITGMTLENGEGVSRSLILTAAGFFRQALQIQCFMNKNRIGSASALGNLLKGASASEKAEWVEDGSDFVTMHPFRVQKIAENAMNYKPQETIRAITVLRDALWQCMSSATSARVCLENALFAIVS